MDAVLQKVTKYEAFVNERLRTDLEKILEARDAVYADIAEYLQLQNVVTKLSQQRMSQSNLKTMVDLGANFYAQAKVPDASHVCVAVGLGFYVDFTLDEALEFIAEKVDHLTVRGRVLGEEAGQVRARIQLVLEALKELQFHSQPSPSPPRAVW